MFFHSKTFTLKATNDLAFGLLEPVDYIKLVIQLLSTVMPGCEKTSVSTLLTVWLHKSMQLCCIVGVEVPGFRCLYTVLCSTDFDSFCLETLC